MPAAFTAGVGEFGEMVTTMLATFWLTLTLCILIMSLFLKIVTIYVVQFKLVMKLVKLH